MPSPSAAERAISGTVAPHEEHEADPIDPADLTVVPANEAAWADLAQKTT
jgi:hypothetical protein